MTRALPLRSYNFTAEAAEIAEGFLQKGLTAMFGRFRNARGARTRRSNEIPT